MRQLDDGIGDTLVFALKAPAGARGTTQRRLNSGTPDAVIVTDPHGPEIDVVSRH